MSKKAPPQGDIFQGAYIPGNTRVGYCAWGVARDEGFFGEDASEFRLERWLNQPSEKLRLMESTLDAVFGYGKYQCLGRSFLWMELNKVLVTVGLLNLNRKIRVY